MGSVTVRRERPAWAAAVGATATSALVSVGVAVVAGDVGLAVAVATAAIPVLAGGLLAGAGPAVVVAVLLQAVGVAVALLGRDQASQGSSTAVVAVGLLLWVVFELACSSLELRPARTVRRAALASRAADVVLVGAVGGLAGVVALGASGLVVGGGAPALRLAGVAVVVVPVVAAILLSKRVRTS